MNKIEHYKVAHRSQAVGIMLHVGRHVRKLGSINVYDRYIAKQISWVQQII